MRTGAIGLLLLVSAGLQAQPLTQLNRDPLHQLAAAPLPSGSWRGGQQLALQVQWDNHWLQLGGADEQWRLDGESLWLAVEGRWALNERWRVRARLQAVHWGGGALDSVIDHWHDTFSLPENGRDRAAHGGNYWYYRQGNRVVGETLSGSSLGDTHLSLDYRVSDRQATPWWLSVDLLLPTGDESQLAGRGHWGYAFSANVLEQRWRSGAWFWGRVGLMYVDSTLPLLEERHWQGFAGLGIGWPIAERWQVVGQLDLQSLAWRSQLGALDQPSLQGSIALRWDSPVGQWDLGFSEDLQVESAPDFGLFLHWQQGL